MLCVRAMSKAMSTQGPLTDENRHSQQRSLGRNSIVNLGALSSFVGGVGMTAYITSKHALLGLAKVADDFT